MSCLQAVEKLMEECRITVDAYVSAADWEGEDGAHVAKISFADSVQSYMEAVTRQYGKLTTLWMFASATDFVNHMAKQPEGWMDIIGPRDSIWTLRRFDRILTGNRYDPISRNRTVLASEATYTTERDVFMARLVYHCQRTALIISRADLLTIVRTYQHQAMKNKQI